MALRPTASQFIATRSLPTNNTMTIRVLIAEHNKERREQMRAALAGDTIEIAGTAREGAEAVRLAHALRPDIVLLAEDLPPTNGFAAAEGLTASGLPLETILVCAESSDLDLRRAMRAGAREVICRTAGPAELRTAVQSIHAEHLRRRSASPAEGPALGKVTVVSGAKGGIGKTTLAVNLAAALAAETGEPTVLVDLYTQFGDAALLLNVLPRRTLANLVQVDLADLDAALVENHLERHSCGLKLLAGASAPLRLDALAPDFLEHLLQLLRCDYAHVVLDVPSVLTETTRRALAEADRVLLVANLFDLTTLADTRLWLEAVQTDTVQIVLNRVSPSNKLQMPDIARTLGRTIDFCIPNDGRLVPASVNSGVPFVLSHPGSKAAGSVYALARSLHSVRR